MSALRDEESLWKLKNDEQTTSINLGQSYSKRPDAAELRNVNHLIHERDQHCGHNGNVSESVWPAKNHVAQKSANEVELFAHDEASNGVLLSPSGQCPVLISSGPSHELPDTDESPHEVDESPKRRALTKSQIRGKLKII